MVKYSVVALLVLISLALVLSAPAGNEEDVGAEGAVDDDVEDVQPSATRKIKRGIYGGYGGSYGYGFGYYPYSYGYYPYGGHYGGYGFGYSGYYPYSYGYRGYGHGYYW